MSKPYEKETYFGLTMDPVHIGTGGYRLGRVDNTITREPGTNLPKVPGTGISGVTRAFTAMAIQSENPMIPKKMKYQRPSREITKKDGTKEIVYDSCAGKGGEKGESHCGEPDCEVCVAYGFSKDGNSFQGMAQFFDARILFFPVYSMLGPVWVTSESIMGEFKVREGIMSAIEVKDATLTDKDKEMFRRFNTSLQIPENKLNQIPKNKLNLGWLMLECEDGEVNLTDNSSYIPQEIKERLILVSDKLFSRIVNDNLEVRTSVAIDPATGAAVDGALYTYEAIPRATVLWFDVVYNKPENFRIKQDGVDQPIKHGKLDGKGWEWIKENVEKGLKLIEYMGVGGMNTRGMGRMRILNLKGLENE